MTALVELDAVSFAIGGQFLLRDVTLGFRAGEVTAIVGPNGAGKSTLLKLATGELSPAQGSVRHGGEVLPAIPPWRLACLRAVMPQAARLAFPFPVYDIVRLGLDGIGRAVDRVRRHAIVIEALADMDLLPLASRSVPTLSGGEQQRTHFARAQCQLRAGASVAREGRGGAQALFLDEPVASLDLVHQLAVMDRARAFADEGVAVVVVLHDLNLAAAYADRVAVLHRGRLAACAPPREALTAARIAEVFAVHLVPGAPDGWTPLGAPNLRRIRA